MLAGREDVQTDFLGLLGDDDGGPNPFGLGGSTSCGRVGCHVTDGEDAELYCGHPTALSMTRTNPSSTNPTKPTGCLSPSINSLIQSGIHPRWTVDHQAFLVLCAAVPYAASTRSLRMIRFCWNRSS